MKQKESLLAALLLLPLAAVAALDVTDLRVESLRTPLGIDTPTPAFSWLLNSDERGCTQVSYAITVVKADGTQVWSSGTISSNQHTGIAYAGTALESCSAYSWTVTLTDNRGRTATRTSSFETAFMDASEWTGKWIYTEGISYQTLDPLVIEFDTPVTCQYVKLNITELGLRASTDNNYSYAQLDEVEIYSGETNVARSATFTASNSWALASYGWDLNYINDGQIGSGSRNGWTTTTNPSTPITVTANLGSTQTITKIKLYPRQNDHATGKASNIAANFPAAFTIQTSTDNSSYEIAYTKEAETYHVPYFDKSFTVTGDKTVSRARIYASALGVFTMKLNGSPVTDAVLEPGESEYEKTVLYSTYDVTDLIQSGANQLLAQVAGGIYNIEYLSGRFSKGEVKNNGQTALLAELLIEYTDGSSERIVTDGTWRTAPSPTLGSNWWGGEDYDAKLKDSSWRAVSVLDSPSFSCPHSGVSGFGTLRSRMFEPLRVVEQWSAVSVKTITSGGNTLRMVDFGRNFAGQYRFRLKGRRGQTITLRCGESLNADGSVYMENYYTGPADTYDTYTFAGDEDGEIWGPEFMYHGFRYLQIIGLDEEPAPSAFTAMRIRSDMDNVGTLTTSNALINDIHVICRDAIASQLYNSITDCPHREKLGWLDVPNEMYNSLNANFDMQTFYKKVVLDCFDAQQADGHVPSVAPYYMNVYGDDVNWGGAAILVPYRNWRYYGDKSLMTKYYDQMKLLLDHYTANTTGFIINNSFSVLSDWGQETAGVSPMVPTEFTETATYYYLLLAMAEIATELGQGSDASAYTDLATNVKTAFNTKFYDAVAGVYTSISGGGGRQGEQAMPLYYGLVPEGDETKVAAVLAAQVAADGYKVKTGEIALKPVFMSLARYGYNDVVWQMAKQTDCPSYGYWVRQGYTTTPEYWDVGAYSQNHCMMDHIEEWFFSELAGIKTHDNSSIYSPTANTLHLQPYLPDDLNSLDVTQRMPAGQVRMAWQRLTDGYRFQLSIPAGAQASVILPTIEGKRLKENGMELAAGTGGVVSITYGTTETQLIIGSGDYDLTLGEGTAITAADSETFWLPVHGNDELPVGSTIRIQTADAERYIGSSGSNTVSAGKFLTGADASGAATLAVTSAASAVLDDVTAELLTLQESSSLLHVGAGSADSRLLGWSTANDYTFGFSFNGSAATIFRNSGGTTATGNYLYFYDSGANSGIFATGTVAQAQTWHVFRQGDVMTEAATRLAATTAGTDRMTLTRTFVQGWNTICLPFDVAAADVIAAVGDGVEVAAFAGTATVGDVTTVNFEVVTSGIAANTPYLIYVPQAMQETPATFTGIVTAETSLAVAPDGSLFAFTGSYIDTNDAIAAGDYILTAGSTFRQAVGSNRLRPFRAYMKNLSPASVKAASVALTVSGSQTGINTIDNSQLAIHNDDVIYDLQGRHIMTSTKDQVQRTSLPKGLYIINGKKILIR